MVKRRMNHSVAQIALLVSLALSCVFFSACDPGYTISAPIISDPNLTPFDGDRAFGHLETVVEFGPRPPDTDAARRTQEYIIDELQGFGVQVIEDSFVASTPLGQKRMKNIIAEIPGTTNSILILGGHYDTKLFEDFTFVGANDGGSSTALLIEMAKILSENWQAEGGTATVWVTFFDGEEAFVRWTATDSLYGSRHLRDKMVNDGSLDRLKAVVVADMIGDRGLKIKKITPDTGPKLQDIIWDTAAGLGYGAFFSVERQILTGDDHTPFFDAGKPATTVIDFVYGIPPLIGERNYWHTERDTLDKVAPESLKVVGDVLYKSLFQIDVEL